MITIQTRSLHFITFHVVKCLTLGRKMKKLDDNLIKKNIIIHSHS